MVSTHPIVTSKNSICVSGPGKSNKVCPPLDMDVLEYGVGGPYPDPEDKSGLVLLILATRAPSMLIVHSPSPTTRKETQTEVPVPTQKKSE
jgi:hypothetical protein